MRRRWVLSPILVGLMLGGGPMPSSSAAQPEPDTDLIVTFRREGTAAAILKDEGIDGARRVTPLVAEIRATAREAIELRERPGVVAVEKPVIYRIGDLPNDPCVVGCGGLRTVYLDPLGIPQAWNTSTGAGVNIAVVDGGVEVNDPDLFGQVVQQVDYLGGAPGAIDHGTAVAALAAAATNDGIGIPGVARDAKIRSFKVVEAGGTATEVNVARAIRDAADLGVGVINLSLAGPDSPAVHAELDRAISRGVVVVAAAGNRAWNVGSGVYDPQDDALSYPARYSGVVAVGASTRNDTAADFSFRGSWVDVFAPGTELAVPHAPGPGYDRFDGTSGAAPLVSGAVALLRSAQPSLGPGQIEDRLRATSIPLGDGLADERRVQVFSLLRGPDPFGALDVVSGGPGEVTAQGWAIDPNTLGPVQVHVYVDGQGYATGASGTRSDIGLVFPGYGANHGFSVRVPASAGAHGVCAYAINVAAGGNQLVGCRSVSIGGSPIGALDLVRQVPGGVEASGWSLDLDTRAQIEVHAYAGGTGIATTADHPRSDIGWLFPAWGPDHGYLTTIQTVASGPLSVCTYGINVGVGGNAALGCRSVTLRQNPFGAIDSVSRVDGRVRIQGWAIDPSVGAPIDVHLYVGGSGSAYPAAESRPDVASAFPGYGALHGYDVSVMAPPGALLCVYGINVGEGGNALVGCRTAP